MITAGIDCGAKNTKTVIMKDGKIAGNAKVLTGFDQESAVEKSLNKTMVEVGVSKDDIQKIISTGFGNRTGTDGTAGAHIRQRNFH